MFKTSIIITTRILDDDLMDITAHCIQRILKNTFHDYELIIVDNNSKEPYKFMLEGLLHQNDKFVSNNFNGGNGMAWDQGIASASNDMILLMDNDCWPLVQDWDKEMIGKLSDNQIGITFPNCIVGDAFDRMTAGLNVEFTKRRDGFCFAFRKETYRKAGPFLVDQPFKLGYYEDDNFEANVQYKLGLDLVGCDSSRVWHRGQATSKKMWNDEFAQGIEDNKKWYEKKWDKKYPYLKE